jgi:hypothetical protein
MSSAQTAGSSTAQLAAFEAIRLRSAAAADRVVAQAEVIGEAEMHSAAMPGHRAPTIGVGYRGGTECDDVQGCLR